MCIKKYLETAVLAAREAGKIHKKYFNTDLRIETKSTSYDRVTIADVEAEEAIAALIKQNYPDHNILGEENKYVQTDSSYQWIIDPLDGTNNFSHGMPIFSVSIALAKNGKVLMGVVYDPMRDELFSACEGAGAFLNNKKIHVKDIDRLTDSLLITGFYYDRGPRMIETLDKIRQFFEENVIGVRRLGSAALDLCWIACGRATGYWEFQLSPWDFAAGMLLVEEAGGKVTNLQGQPLALEKTFVVASNNKIHTPILNILQK